MTVIKMLRTTSDNTFIGDRQYTVADPQADAMVKNGDAVLVERLPAPTAGGKTDKTGKSGKDKKAEAAKSDKTKKPDKADKTKKPDNFKQRPKDKKRR